MRGGADWGLYFARVRVRPCVTNDSITRAGGRGCVQGMDCWILLSGDGEKRAQENARARTLHANAAFVIIPIDGFCHVRYSPR